MKRRQARQMWIGIQSPGLRGSLRSFLATWICAAGMLFPALLPAQTLSREEAGKLIYNKSESPSGSTLEAVLGDTVAPATLMPCGSCHGADGKGRTEGGIVPSDITWSVLTRPRETDQAMERRRQAYDVSSLRKVLREGVDPGGNELGITMPRYRIADGDLDSLIAYLQQLGVKNDPGVTATSIRAATVVPGKGSLAEAGNSVADLLQAYFTELNQQGGVYGRQIQLEIIQADGTPAETAGTVREFVRSHDVFALVGLMVPEAERQLSDSLEDSGVPAIGMFAPDEDRILAKPKVFHVLPGLTAQARVLVQFAQERLSEDRIRQRQPGSSRVRTPDSLALLFPESQQRLAAAVIEECGVRSCRSVRSMVYAGFDAGKTVTALAIDKPGGILFLGNGPELKALLAAAARIHWEPQIFQPGALAGEEAFLLSPEASDRVFFSFPTLPSDVAPEALAEYGFLVRKYKLRPMHAARALSALAAAKVFVEGLRQSGRDLSRDRFVDTLSALYNFNTGLTPPITYGATRRVGALGAYVVKLDTRTGTFAAAGAWIEASR